MRVLHFDFSAGAAGDMFLGALLELFPSDDRAGMLKELNGLLDISGLELEFEQVQRAGLAGTKVRVLFEGREEIPGYTEDHNHVHFHQLQKRIASTSFSKDLKARGEGLFWSLCEAEGKAHGMDPAKVGLHEVGAADALADILGTLWLVERLAPDHVSGSALNLGSGTVRCAHGEMVVPVPAVSRILEGVPVYSNGPAVELTTPTGALLAKHLCRDFGNLPAMTLEGEGRGAGTRDFSRFANQLCVYLGAAAESPARQLWLVETQLDDATGKEAAAAVDGLLAAGARDAWVSPVVMKKGRPGMIVACICEERDISAMETVLLAELPTLGIRRYPIFRTELEREEVAWESPRGTIMAKRRRLPGHGWQWLSLDEDTLRTWAKEDGRPSRDLRQELMASLNEEKNRQ